MEQHDYCKQLLWIWNSLQRFIEQNIWFPGWFGNLWKLYDGETCWRSKSWGVGLWGVITHPRQVKELCFHDPLRRKQVVAFPSAMTGTSTSLDDVMSFLPWNHERNRLSARKVFMWGIGSWWWEKLNYKPFKLSFKVSLKSGLNYINLGRSPNKNYEQHPMGWGPGIKENEDVTWMLTSFHALSVSGCPIALTSPPWWTGSLHSLSCLFSGIFITTIRKVTSTIKRIRRC